MLRCVQFLIVVFTAGVLAHNAAYASAILLGQTPEQKLEERKKREEMSGRERAADAARKQAALEAYYAYLDKRLSNETQDDTEERLAFQVRVTEYQKLLAKRAPGLLPDLGAYATSSNVGCRRGDHEKTHAILIGTNAGMTWTKSHDLSGPQNDLALMSGLLRDRGVDAENIHLLSGRLATRANIQKSLRTILGNLGCGDRVFIHFSGSATAGSLMARNVIQRDWNSGAKPSDETLSEDQRMIAGRASPYDRLIEQQMRADVLPESSSDHETEARDKELRDKYVASLKPVMKAIRAAFSEDTVFLLDDQGSDTVELILGAEFSEAITAIRNGGAHAIILFDGCDAGGAAIETRQRASGDGGYWRYDFAERQDGWSDENRFTPLGPGHGDFVALYAAGTSESTPELKLPKDVPDANVYGLFTFTVAGGLRDANAVTPRALGDVIQSAYGKRTPIGGKTHPRIEASNPDLVLIAEAAPPGSDAITILSPQQTRGAAAVAKASIEISGLVKWNAPVLGVFVDDSQAQVDRTGKFKQTVSLKPGLNRIGIRAITADNRLHARTLELVFDGDVDALKGDGRRYAVIIANQDYGEATGMPSLSTPIADADALAAILTARYGFDASVALAGGKTQSLVLKNATKRQIESALFQLGKVAGAKDSVLIFYAGHGVFEQITSTAYWVPGDAEQGFEPSYLSAADISAAIQRIQAGSLILISDSCYSGALMRSGPVEVEQISEDQRNEALLKLRTKKSRVVMTSGNNEPVADGGGSGHSIFARALLTGLEKMDHDAFSARELFNQFVLQQVTANGDQEPQFRPMEKVGHEGGDFIFVKVDDEERQGAAAGMK